MTEQRPTVSVIIPAHNSSRFIKKTIESVINQTYEDWELVVVDDGSQDNTEEIVRSLCVTNKRIKYFSQDNFGAPSRPTNRGIREGRGDYIAILQHDDEWLPEKLEKQIILMNTATGKDADFIGCDAFIVNDTKKSEARSILCVPERREDFLYALLSSNILPYPSAMLIRKRVFENFGYFDEEFNMADDWEMWIRLAAQGVSFASIHEPLFKYHIHGTNITKTIATGKMIKDLEYLAIKHESLYSRYPRARSRMMAYLGKLYADDGELTRAQSILKQAIVLDRANWKAYVTLLISSLGIKTYRRAASAIKFFRGS